MVGVTPRDGDLKPKVILSTLPHFLWPLTHTLIDLVANLALASTYFNKTKVVSKSEGKVCFTFNKTFLFSNFTTYSFSNLIGN